LTIYKEQNKMKKIFLAVLLTAITSTASAQYQKPGSLQVMEYTPVSAGPLTAAVTTGWLKTGGFSKLTIEALFVDADSSITRLDWVCVSAIDDSTPTGASATYGMKTISVSAGTITYSSAAPQMAVAGTENFILNMDLNYRWLQCSFSVGAGTATATVDTMALAIRARAGK
jgi:hypothetical protein